MHCSLLVGCAATRQPRRRWHSARASGRRVCAPPGAASSPRCGAHRRAGVKVLQWWTRTGSKAPVGRLGRDGGNALSNGLLAFQAAQGLAPDGIASPLTLMRLNRALGVDEPDCDQAPRRLKGRLRLSITSNSQRAGRSRPTPGDDVQPNTMTPKAKPPPLRPPPVPLTWRGVLLWAARGQVISADDATRTAQRARATAASIRWCVLARPGSPMPATAANSTPRR